MEEGRKKEERRKGGRNEEERKKTGEIDVQFLTDKCCTKLRAFIYRKGRTPNRASAVFPFIELQFPRRIRFCMTLEEK